MKKIVFALGGIVAFFVVLGLGGVFFVVEPYLSAIVLQFGEPKQVNTEPGLYFKVPFLQNVQFYDMRAMCFEAPTEQVITSDKKRLLVDAYIVYRLVDPVAFYKRLRNHQLARLRMHALTVSSLRGSLGKITFEHFLKDKRKEVLEEIQRSIMESTKEFGIEIIDVRISKSELPPQNSQAIYRRMVSERTRIAKRVRAEGQEKATKMVALSEKEAARIITDARKQSVEIQADAKAYACFKHGEMAAKDKQLFKVYKGSEFLKQTLSGQDHKFILSSNNKDILMPLRDVVSVSS
ncbi:MAG: protease modulator HflC [Alphaproteobacteria bacterium]|nr:protease modulator HflC [Alphaproteobacteria bacterium]